MGRKKEFEKKITVRLRKKEWKYLVYMVEKGVADDVSDAIRKCIDYVMWEAFKKMLEELE